MLNTYIINLDNRKEKFDNIMNKLGKNNGLNLMKVNLLQFESLFVDEKIKKLLELFSLNNNNYSLTYLKLIENLQCKLTDNDYSLIFDNTKIPKFKNIKKQIEDIVKKYDINKKKWDIIKLINSPLINCFIINKSGQNKIMKYQCTNNKLNLNIYHSNIDLFILNKEKIYSNYFTKNINFISNCICNNLMEILFVKLIIINVGVVLYFIHKN